MKTIKLLGFLMLLAFTTYSQEVPRDKVILEIGTGTWCYYCPGAAMGADDLIANGKQVAVVEYHGGGVDNFINEYSTARIGYYGVTGYPTAYFDGGNSVVGGSHTNSMYSTYLPKYNQRIAIPSPFTINMIGSKIGTNDYQVTVTLEKVATVSNANLVMHFVVTESEIPQNWQGMTEVNFVERLMIPGASGTPLDFSTNNVRVQNLSFTLEPTWVKAHCEIVVFIQNTATKEIFQGTKHSLSEFDVTYNLDAAIVNTAVPKTICTDSFVPKVKIANWGTDNLTSLSIITQINGEPSITYNWTGNLFYTQTTIVQLPEIAFTPLNDNSILIWVENPNGQPDQFTSNDIKLLNLNDAPSVTSPVSLALKLDDNPGQTTWALFNSDGISLYAGGPYTQANQFVVQTFVLNDADCYTFVIYDAGGDGLKGQGLYKLAYQGSTIFAEGKAFGFEDQVQFGIGLTGINESLTHQEFSVVPNPIKDIATISFDLKQNSPVKLRVYNATGEKVFESAEQMYSIGKNQIIFESKNLNSGIYYFSLVIDGNQVTQKVIIAQ
jgi:hypothetical protein